MAKKNKEDYGVINPVVFIPGNVPSLKNSKVKTSRGIFPSKTVVNYLRSLNIQTFSSSKKIVKGYKDKDKPNLFLKAIEPLGQALLDYPEKPVFIGLHFVRKTKADFDFNNGNQLICDLLTAHDIIEDDCMRLIVPIPFRRNGLWYTVDKDNPGVYLKLINYEDLTRI